MSSPTDGVRMLGAAAADLLLGACCAGCAAPGWGLCADCRAELAAWRPHDSRPDPCPPGFPSTVSCAPYAGLASNLISAYKDRQAWSLASVLGRVLADSVDALLPGSLRLGTPLDGALLGAGPPSGLVLVPAPSSARAVRERGLDAGQTIARVAARELRRRHRRVRVVPLLRQRAKVLDQAGLDADQRAANLAGALRVIRSGWLPARRIGPTEVVVITDDVVTTGATLVEAHRALTEAGVRVVGAATVAATMRRSRG